ncbi:hypothetical protein [Nocardia paucivorans]|uniref:hypothetical protein n=1 Tax=Nocardia paucivorans TaxID=114259 RepID=UPI000308E0AE|nr:hypothetical protein [Nocardia paucivorans]
MTIEQSVEHPVEDDVTQLARRVEKARRRLAYQFDPALTEALSEGELQAERELAERIREQEREQRWKEIQAAASAADRARQTTQEIEKADMRDLLIARKAIAAQRRESSPHAKLASLYRHRAWSLRALAGVVGAGMLWSAVNVQQNIAPTGPTDPLFWFSYLLEAMISVCLVIIMIGTSKVSEWEVLDSRGQVVAAELALLSLTVGLNTYPYIQAGNWYDVAVHAVAPVMIGVALLIHEAVSSRYGMAIARATEQVRDLPDPAEQIRRTLPRVGYHLSAAADAAQALPEQSYGELEEASSSESDEYVDIVDAEEAGEEPETAESASSGADSASKEAAAPSGGTTRNAFSGANGSARFTDSAGTDGRSTTLSLDDLLSAADGVSSTKSAAKLKADVPLDEQLADWSPPLSATDAPAPPAKKATSAKSTTRTTSKSATARSASSGGSTAAKKSTAGAGADASGAAEGTPAPAKKTGRSASAKSTSSTESSSASKKSGGRSGKASASENSAGSAESVAGSGAVSESAAGSSTPGANGAENSGSGDDGSIVAAYPHIFRPNSTYDTGQYRVADMLEQDIAKMQAERERRRAQAARSASKSGA